MLERTDSRTSEMLKQLLPKSSSTKNDWAKELGPVLIIAEEKSLETANAQFALCMAVNMLSRLYPIITHIYVSIPRSATLTANVPLFARGTIRDALMNFVNKLKPDCKVEFIYTPKGHWDATLCIGSSSKELENTISIASDGWVAYVSTKGLSTCFTEKYNPIGAYAASCIGGIEIFKRIFLKKSSLLEPEKEPFDVRWRLRLIEGLITFSTFDYRVNENEPKNPPLPSNIDLGDLYIVGVGAGGGAAAYTLASLRDLQGRLNLIDPDEVKPGNMNRYVYALNADSTGNRLKVEVAKELFKSFDKLDVQMYPCSYQELKESEKIALKDVLISTVDTKETRRNIQWGMPRVILDAAVVSTEFYIRRVDIGESPCLICTHKADRVERPIEELLSEVTGLHPKEIMRLRSTNALFCQGHIDQMREFSKIHGFALPSVGDRFSDWLIMHCGELVSPVGQERFPLPFAAVLPGVLIAGEVIKDRCFVKDVLQNYYSYDMINVPMSGAIPLKPAPDCIFCSFPKTKELHAKKYGKQRTNNHA
jgi:molybdopterin/thiamine biosynthesis adenylyltransferase